MTTMMTLASLSPLNSLRLKIAEADLEDLETLIRIESPVDLLMREVWQQQARAEKPEDRRLVKGRVGRSLRRRI